MGAVAVEPVVAAHQDRFVRLLTQAGAWVSRAKTVVRAFSQVWIAGAVLPVLEEEALAKQEQQALHALQGMAAMDTSFLLLRSCQTLLRVGVPEL